jgi:hypothetical protein
MEPYLLLERYPEAERELALHTERREYDPEGRQAGFASRRHGFPSRDNRVEALLPRGLPVVLIAVSPIVLDILSQTTTRTP